MKDDNGVFLKSLEDFVAPLFGPAGNDGTTMIPFQDGGKPGTVKVREEIMIYHPTREKVLEAIRQVMRSGRRVNLYIPRRFSDPLVIVKEEFVDLGKKLLLERRGY